MKFNTDDVRVRWMLYRYHNRRHDGEIWYLFSTPNGVVLMEQCCKWSDYSELLGEVRTRIIKDEFVDEIVPIVERSDEELRQMRQQTVEHKKYRLNFANATQ